MSSRINAEQQESKVERASCVTDDGIMLIRAATAVQRGRTIGAGTHVV